jgi:uncharacterized protein
MIDPLSPIEVRVVAALAEKALATPEYYPMSLNALINACNQKTGRDPVMDLSESEVATALDELMRRGFAGTTSGAGSRVEKYRHLLDHAFALDRPGVAALAVLMLRGPQTTGEVRSRTGRLYEFESLSEAEQALRRLADQEEPLVAELPLQPGRKEPRFAHLLGGPVDVAAAESAPVAAPEAMAAARARGDRLDQLEQRVEQLEEQVESLKAAFEGFRKQFE